MHMSMLRRTAQPRFGKALAIFTIALLLPAIARAETVYRFDGATTGASGVLLLPCVKVALVASDDLQSASTLTTNRSNQPVVTTANRNGRMFAFEISVVDLNGQSIRLFPPGPCRDGTCQYTNVLGVANDGTRLLFHVNLASSDGLVDQGTIAGFNPQPDPPGDFSGLGAMIVDFGIANVTAATVSATLLVLNQSTGRVVTLQ